MEERLQKLSCRIIVGMRSCEKQVVPTLTRSHHHSYRDSPPAHTFSPLANAEMGASVRFLFATANSMASVAQRPRRAAEQSCEYRHRKDVISRCPHMAETVLQTHL